MSSTLMPFLYRTQTLQRAWRVPTATGLSFGRRRLTRATATCAPSPQHSDAIPFEWETEDEPRDARDGPDKPSTITPAEAAVFKGIFDEIAKGKMPKARKRPEPAASDWFSRTVVPAAEGVSQARTSRAGGVPRSIVEQARLTDFRDNFLQRYPKSLQNAAQVALGLYALEPEPEQATTNRSQMPELQAAEKAKAKERARYETARTKERERVDAAMSRCSTDAALWNVMSQEVFKLPEKLGILQLDDSASGHKKTKRGVKGVSHVGETKVQTVTGTSSGTSDADKDRHVMDVHGPLYSHFLSFGLALFDAAFASPSPYAFQILPRIKSLGLPSYVLGVSTPFYARLARMYWTQFGDASSALDVLQEMNSVGLYADQDVLDLLVQIRDHIHGCAWGAQGEFVMAMVESPPYDGGLIQRLEDMERQVKHSLGEEAM